MPQQRPSANGMQARSDKSIFRHVAAPAPRYMMRLALVEKLICRISEPVVRFAEIGPGLGDTSLFLSEMFPEAKGDLIELSGESASLLELRTASINGLSVLNGDFRDLPLQDGYDLVIACEVFEHLQNDDSAFDAVNRLLKPGGYFLLSVPAFMHKWQAADEYAGHFRRYERDQLAQKLVTRKLDIHEFWCYGFPVTHLLALPYRIYYNKQLRDRPLPKTEATKRSGAERSLARKLNRLPISTLMSPFFFLQNMVKATNVGDGYLVLARK